MSKRFPSEDSERSPEEVEEIREEVTLLGEVGVPGGQGAERTVTVGKDFLSVRHRRINRESLDPHTW